MSQIIVQTTHAANTELTEDNLDVIRDSIETFVNITKLGDDNIQDAGITASSKIVDGTITAAKIAPSAATAAKITAANVTTAKLDSTCVTTAKLAANAVTNAKLADFNYSVSSDIGFSTTSTSDTLVATVSITTNGRPVRIALFPGSSSILGACRITMSTASTDTDNSTRGVFVLKRSSTEVAKSIVDLTVPRISHQTVMPGTMITFIDDLAAGTYTYNLYARTINTNTTLQVLGRLVVYEM